MPGQDTKKLPNDLGPPVQKGDHVPGDGLIGGEALQDSIGVIKGCRVEMLPRTGICARLLTDGPIGWMQHVGRWSLEQKLIIKVAGSFMRPGYMMMMGFPDERLRA